MVKASFIIGAKGKGTFINDITQIEVWLPCNKVVVPLFCSFLDNF